MIATNDSRQPIDRDDITNAMEAADLTETVGTVNDTYSGRGMNGQTCLSFVMDGHWGATRKVAKFVAALTLIEAQAGDDDFPTATNAEALADVVSLDDLGMDTIVYFPGWKLA